MQRKVEVVRAGETLRRQGYRLTPQRLMILDAVIAGEAHVTAEDIHHEVAEQWPEMSLSTVYRTLETLRDLGLVTETDLGNGRVEYHFAERAKHHHLVCRKCGTVAQLDNTFFAPISEALHQQYGFHAELNHFALFGTCGKCTDTAAAEPDTHGHSHEHAPAADAAHA